MQVGKMMMGLMLTGLIAFTADFGQAANYSGNVTIRPMSPTASWTCTLQPKDSAAFSVTVINTESGYRLKSGPTPEITGQDILWTGGPTTFNVVNEAPEVSSTQAKVTCVWEPYGGGGGGHGPRPPDINGLATGTAQLKVAHIEWGTMTPLLQVADGTSTIAWEVKLVDDNGALVSGISVNFALSAVNVSPSANWQLSPSSGSGPRLVGTVASANGSRGNLKVDYTYFGHAKSSTSGQIAFVKVEKVQYEQPSGTWNDISGTLYVLKGSTVTFKAVPTPLVTWPSGKPVWGGSSGASGAGETKAVAFNTSSMTITDYKTVTATCGDTKTANIVVYELAGTLTPDDNFANRSQSKYGLEEQIELAFTTDPAGITKDQAGGLKWTKNSGVGFVSSPGDSGLGNYDAQNTAGNVTLRLTIQEGLSKDQFKSYDRTVVAPSGTRMTRATANVKHSQGTASAGIALYYWLDPTDVSFWNLTFGEGSCPSTSVSGFYLTCWPWNSYPTGGQIGAHAQNIFGAVSGGNSTTGCRVIVRDGAVTGDANPYAAGSFTWSIPTHYIDDTSTRYAFGANQNHVSTFQANGDATQAKGGQSGSAAVTNSTSGW